MRKFKNTRKIFVMAIIMAVIMLIPAEASAAFSVNISISKQEDGSSCGELWLGNELFWRLIILPDGVRPTFGGSKASNTTYLTPAIVDGMFVINVK